MKTVQQRFLELVERVCEGKRMEPVAQMMHANEGVLLFVHEGSMECVARVGFGFYAEHARLAGGPFKKEGEKVEHADLGKALARLSEHLVDRIPIHDGPVLGFSAEAWDTMSSVLETLRGLNAEVVLADGTKYPARIGEPSVGQHPKDVYETWGVMLTPLDPEGFITKGPPEWHALEDVRSISVY